MNATNNTVIENTQPLRRQRAPRKCGICGQHGHNRTTCPVKVLNERRVLAFDCVFNRIIARVPDLLSYPELLLKAHDDIRQYIFSLSAEDALYASHSNQAHPRSCQIINTCYSMLLDMFDSEKESFCDHITVVLDISSEEGHDNECNICFEEKCSVTAGCTHEYCKACVLRIMEESNKKEEIPLCSFCRTPFNVLTCENVVSYTDVSEFVSK